MTHKHQWTSIDADRDEEARWTGRTRDYGSAD